jgi:hypothetical protein
MLAPQLRQTLLRLSRNAKAKDLAQRALRGLAGFAKSLKLKFEDIEVGFDFEPEPGLADNGDLEHDLQALLEAAGAAAQQADSALAIFVDELQYVEEEQLAALITALHRTAQRKLPVVLVGAGLPQLRGRMGRAKSYAERLFDFPDIGPLSPDAARQALVIPAREQQVEFTDDALDRIQRETQGYPYFVQEWGKHTWDVATTSPITLDDDATAEIGPGPHRSGDIAEQLGRAVTSLGPSRGSLIGKGMVWSPNHGDTAFTVPLFDEFMHRIMPGGDWRE